MRHRHAQGPKGGAPRLADGTIMSEETSSERIENQPPAPEVNMKPIPTKLVLLGESAVGKTSIVHRFVQDEFQENREPTIGAAFLTVSTIH